MRIAIVGEVQKGEKRNNLEDAAVADAHESNVVAPRSLSGSDLWIWRKAVS